MSIDKYIKKIDDLIKNTSLTKEDVFEYDLSPFKDEFDEVFNFYSETLDTAKDYGIEQSIIFFNNEYSINARASKENDFFIISMNMGTIVELLKMFKDKNDLLDETLHADLITIEKDFDVPINVLMFQNVIHFTFYHELAHLIQKSKYLESNLYESIENDSAYDQLSHILELDADEYSSLCLGNHLLDFGDKIYGKDLDKYNFENIITILGASIFLYLKNFHSNIHKLYYEEKSHPHPIIRVTNIIFTLIHYCKIGLQKKEIDISEIKPDIIINKILKFSEEISTKVLNKAFWADDYKDIIANQMADIIGYYKKIREIRENSELAKTLAVYKWNQNIKIIMPPNK